MLAPFFQRYCILCSRLYGHTFPGESVDTSYYGSCYVLKGFILYVGGIFCVFSGMAVRLQLFFMYRGRLFLCCDIRPLRGRTLDLVLNDFIYFYTTDTDPMKAGQLLVR